MTSIKEEKKEAKQYVTETKQERSEAKQNMS